MNPKNPKTPPPHFELPNELKEKPAWQKYAAPQHLELLEFFAFEHLPHPLKGMSQVFHAAAMAMMDQWAMNCVYSPDKIFHSAELTVALRKLLESKDSAVRSLIPTRVISASPK